MPRQALKNFPRHGETSGTAVSAFRTGGSRLWPSIQKGRHGRLCFLLQQRLLLQRRALSLWSSFILKLMKMTVAAESPQTLQRLFSYTTEDALYTDFDVSYENFFSGKAAMIPNGYWMMDQIPEEWQDKILSRFSAFPENKLISSPETFGWAIISGYSPEVKEGAMALFKLRTQMNMEEKEALFAQDPKTMIPAQRDYIQVYKNGPQLVPNYQVKWNSILQEETLGEILPELALEK